MKLSFAAFLFSAALFAQAPLLLNMGGPAVDNYQAGQYCTGATWNSQSPNYDPAIGTGVWADLLYGHSITCDIPWPVGFWRIVLGLEENRAVTADPTYSGLGTRVFTAVANGISTGPMDLFKLAGPQVPYTKELLIANTDGHIRITLTSTIGNAVLSALDIRPPTITGIQPTEHAVAFFVQLSDGETRTAVVTTPMTVAEMQVCQGAFPPVPPAVISGSCPGLAFIRLANPDGTDGGSFIAIAAPPGMVLSPTNWTPIPVN